MSMKRYIFDPFTKRLLELSESPNKILYRYIVLYLKGDRSFVKALSPENRRLFEYYVRVKFGKKSMSRNVHDIRNRRSMKRKAHDTQSRRTMRRNVHDIRNRRSINRNRYDKYSRSLDRNVFNNDDRSSRSVYVPSRSSRRSSYDDYRPRHRSAVRDSGGFMLHERPVFSTERTDEMLRRVDDTSTSRMFESSTPQDAGTFDFDRRSRFPSSVPERSFNFSTESNKRSAYENALIQKNPHYQLSSTPEQRASSLRLTPHNRSSQEEETFISQSPIQHPTQRASIHSLLPQDDETSFFHHNQ